MKVSIASDHGGFELKEKLVDRLKAAGHDVIDNGTHDEESVDYPDYAEKVARDILSGKAERGVLVCGTGIGISIAANKFKGIRCALVHREEYAQLCREHNDANVIAFGGRFIEEEVAFNCLDIFLSTKFEAGRHLRRVSKLYNLGE